jgi:hypothetical protein
LAEWRKERGDIACKAILFSEDVFIEHLKLGIEHFSAQDRGIVQ